MVEHQCPHGTIVRGVGPIRCELEWGHTPMNLHQYTVNEDQHVVWDDEEYEEL